MSGAYEVADRPDLALHDVDAERRSSVALDAIAAAKRRHQRESRRPPALTAREALVALQFEAMLVLVAAANLRNGVDLTEEDWDRLATAHRRIQAIADEVAR